MCDTVLEAESKSFRVRRGIIAGRSEALRDREGVTTIDVYYPSAIYCLAKAVYSLARRRNGQCLSMRAWVRGCFVRHAKLLWLDRF